MSLISLDQVSYTYYGRKEPAVSSVSLQIFKGEKIAITGLNGSGKSTLAKLMLGLLKPQKGQVYLHNCPIEKYPLPEIGRKLGYVSQRPYQMLFNTTVYKEIAFGLKWKGKTRTDTYRLTREYLEYFDLWHLKDELPYNLSEGQKQLVVISAVLVLEPEFLILDEPTKSLDKKRKKHLQSILYNIWSRGTGIILISHDRAFIKDFQGRRVHMVRGEVDCDES